MLVSCHALVHALFEQYKTAAALSRMTQSEISAGCCEEGADTSPRSTPDRIREAGQSDSHPRAASIPHPVREAGVLFETSRRARAAADAGLAARSPTPPPRRPPPPTPVAPPALFPQ